MSIWIILVIGAVVGGGILLATRKKSDSNSKPTQAKGPWAGWSVQLPINDKGSKSGRMSSVTPPKTVSPWLKLGSTIKFRIDGKPCATSPNSNSCRTEMKELSYHRKGKIKGEMKVLKASADTSIIQTCGENIGCPSFMFRYDSDGYFRWHANGKTKSGREKIDSGRLSKTTPLNKKVDFSIEFGNGEVKGEIDGEKFTCKHDNGEKHHLKFGVYGSDKAEVWFYNVKITH